MSDLLFEIDHSESPVPEPDDSSDMPFGGRINILIGVLLMGMLFGSVIYSERRRRQGRGRIGSLVFDGRGRRRSRDTDRPRISGHYVRSDPNNAEQMRRINVQMVDFSRNEQRDSLMQHVQQELRTMERTTSHPPQVAININQMLEELGVQQQQTRTGTGTGTTQTDGGELPPMPKITQVNELNEKSKNETCVICLDKLQIKTVAAPPCGHVMHEDCLRKWMNVDRSRACPVCRVGASRSTEIDEGGTRRDEAGPSAQT